MEGLIHYTFKILFYWTNIQSDSNISSHFYSNLELDPARTRRNRGKRAGALVRFRQRSNRPPLPAVFLSNARSLCNKFDELFYLTANYRDYQDCSAFCFTETRLHSNISDTTVCPPGFKVHRADRSNELANKRGSESGAGICFLINERWCSISTVI